MVSLNFAAILGERKEVYLHHKSFGGIGMKLLKQGIAAIIIAMIAFSFAAAQDTGVRDTLRFSPVTVDWIIDGPEDSISPVIEVWAWSDQDLGGTSCGFIVSWDVDTYDQNRWSVPANDTGVSAVDSLIVVDTFLFSATLPPAVQFGSTYRRSVLDGAYRDAIDLDWGYNGFNFGLLTFSGTVFPANTQQKIGDLYLKFVDMTSDSLTPDEFTINIDSMFFPPAGTFKFSPVTGGGSGYPPIVVGCEVNVTNSISDADDDNPSEEILPQQFQLAQNYPNPFNPTTTIKYYVASKGIVNLSVYNILGQRVKTLVDGQMDIGWQEAQWNGKDENGNSVASGIYFYKMSAGDYVDSKKMLLMK